jgi:cytochrome b561
MNNAEQEQTMTETKMRYDPITISLHWATALLS